MASVPDKAPAIGEAAIVVTIVFGWFIVLSIYSVFHGVSSSAGFSDASLTGMLMTECALGTAALLFLRSRGHALGTLLPAPDWRGSLEGIALYAVAIVACTGVAMLVPSNEDVVQPIAAIMANSRPSLGVVLAISLVNGLYEETFLLGYLERSFAAFGASFAIGFVVLVRLLYHLYQGPDGALSAAVFGIVLGAVYGRTRRLWPAVLAHALADAIALWP